LKRLQSIMGVFPVAMRTIMVSPMARPKPIINAEKIPGLAEISTSLTKVCQRVAPSARDPAIKCRGTLDSASSEILKIMGTMAKPIANPTTRAFRWSYLSPQWVANQAL
jgi:hypothetical protein